MSKRNKMICLEEEIYIRLQNEKNASFLINKLLMEHYNIKLIIPEKIEKKVIQKNFSERDIEITMKKVLLWSDIDNTKAEILAKEYLNFNEITPCSVNDFLERMNIPLKSSPFSNDSR